MIIIPTMSSAKLTKSAKSVKSSKTSKNSKSGKSSKSSKLDNFEHKYYKTIKAIIWAADKAEVPRELVLAVCWGESSFRNKLVTHMDGETPSYGVCQVKLETARFMDKIYHHKVKATPKMLDKVGINAFYAACYLRYQLAKYNQDWKLAVDAYNKGHAKGHKTQYVKRFEENRKHLKKHIHSQDDNSMQDLIDEAKE